MDLEQAQQFFEERDAKGFALELTGAASGEKAAQSLQNLRWWSADEAGRVLDGSSVSRVQCIGGGEGEGEEVDWVYKIKVEGQDFFLRATGSYYSHDGTYWSGEFEFVEPREVLVTQYFTI